MRRRWEEEIGGEDAVGCNTIFPQFKVLAYAMC